MLDFLKHYNKIFSTKAIEEELEMPPTTLNKALTGQQNLPKKWVKPLNDYITNLKNWESEGKKEKDD
jgi:hypothetical protein